MCIHVQEVLVDSSVAARVDDETSSLTTRVRLPQPFKELAPKAKAQIAFTDVYGYRGCAKELFYLSPWEFTKWWACEPLRAPSWYAKRGRARLTQWTSAEAADVDDPKAGVHYRLIEPVVEARHVAFPDLPATKKCVRNGS